MQGSYTFNKFRTVVALLIAILRAVEAGKITFTRLGSVIHRKEYSMVENLFLSAILDKGANIKNPACRKPEEGLFLTWDAETYIFSAIIL